MHYKQGRYKPHYEVFICYGEERFTDLDDDNNYLTLDNDEEIH